MSYSESGISHLELGRVEKYISRVCRAARKVRDYFLLDEEYQTTYRERIQSFRSSCSRSKHEGIDGDFIGDLHVRMPRSEIISRMGSLSRVVGAVQNPQDTAICTKVIENHEGYADNCRCELRTPIVRGSRTDRSIPKPI